MGWISVFTRDRFSINSSPAVIAEGPPQLLILRSLIHCFTQRWEQGRHWHHLKNPLRSLRFRLGIIILDVT